MINQKQIRQVREVIRRKPLQQVLGFLGLVPSVKNGSHPTFSIVPLNHEQQARYCISEANKFVMQDYLTKAQGYINWAHSLVISDAKRTEGERLRYLVATGNDKGEEYSPRYDISLVKRLRSSMRYYYQRAEERAEGEKPYAYRSVQRSFKEYLEELDFILEARK